jgi:hypothetical protein
MDSAEGGTLPEGGGSPTTPDHPLTDPLQILESAYHPDRNVLHKAKKLDAEQKENESLREKTALHTPDKKPSKIIHLSEEMIKKGERVKMVEEGGKLIDSSDYGLAHGIARRRAAEKVRLNCTGAIEEYIMMFLWNICFVMYGDEALTPGLHNLIILTVITDRDARLTSVAVEYESRNGKGRAMIRRVQDFFDIEAGHGMEELDAFDKLVSKEDCTDFESSDSFFSIFSDLFLKRFSTHCPDLEVNAYTLETAKICFNDLQEAFKNSMQEDGGSNDLYGTDSTEGMLQGITALDAESRVQWKSGGVYVFNTIGSIGKEDHIPSDVLGNLIKKTDKTGNEEIFSSTLHTEGEGTLVPNGEINTRRNDRILVNGKAKKVVQLQRVLEKVWLWIACFNTDDDTGPRVHRFVRAILVRVGLLPTYYDTVTKTPKIDITSSNVLLEHVLNMQDVIYPASLLAKTDVDLPEFNLWQLPGLGEARPYLANCHLWTELIAKMQHAAISEIGGVVGAIPENCNYLDKNGQINLLTNAEFDLFEEIRGFIIEGFSERNTKFDILTEAQRARIWSRCDDAGEAEPDCELDELLEVFQPEMFAKQFRDIVYPDIVRVSDKQLKQIAKHGYPTKEREEINKLMERVAGAIARENGGNEKELKFGNPVVCATMDKLRKDLYKFICDARIAALTGIHPEFPGEQSELCGDMIETFRGELFELYKEIEEEHGTDFALHFFYQNVHPKATEMNETRKAEKQPLLTTVSSLKRAVPNLASCLHKSNLQQRADSFQRSGATHLNSLIERLPKDRTRKADGLFGIVFPVLTNGATMYLSPHAKKPEDSSGGKSREPIALCTFKSCLPESLQNQETDVCENKFGTPEDWLPVRREFKASAFPDAPLVSGKILEKLRNEMRGTLQANTELCGTLRSLTEKHTSEAGVEPDDEPTIPAKINEDEELKDMENEEDSDGESDVDMEEEIGTQDEIKNQLGLVASTVHGFVDMLQESQSEEEEEFTVLDTRSDIIPTEGDNIEEILVSDDDESVCREIKTTSIMPTNEHQVSSPVKQPKVKEEEPDESEKTFELQGSAVVHVSTDGTKTFVMNVAEKQVIRGLEVLFEAPIRILNSFDQFNTDEPSIDKAKLEKVNPSRVAKLGEDPGKLADVLFVGGNKNAKRRARGDMESASSDQDFDIEDETVPQADCGEGEVFSENSDEFEGSVIDSVSESGSENEGGSEHESSDGNSSISLGSCNGSEYDSALDDDYVPGGKAEEPEEAEAEGGACSSTTVDTVNEKQHKPKVPAEYNPLQLPENPTAQNIKDEIELHGFSNFCTYLQKRIPSSSTTLTDEATKQLALESFSIKAPGAINVANAKTKCSLDKEQSVRNALSAVNLAIVAIQLSKNGLETRIQKGFEDPKARDLFNAKTEDLKKMKTCLLEESKEAVKQTEIFKTEARPLVNAISKADRILEALSNFVEPLQVAVEDRSVSNAQKLVILRKWEHNQQKLQKIRSDYPHAITMSQDQQERNSISLQLVAELRDAVAPLIAQKREYARKAAEVARKKAQDARDRKRISDRVATLWSKSKKSRIPQADKKRKQPEEAEEPKVKAKAARGLGGARGIKRKQPEEAEEPKGKGDPKGKRPKGS